MYYILYSDDKVSCRKEHHREEKIDSQNCMEKKSEPKWTHAVQTRGIRCPRDNCVPVLLKTALQDLAGSNTRTEMSSAHTAVAMLRCPRDLHNHRCYRDLRREQGCHLRARSDNCWENKQEKGASVFSEMISDRHSRCGDIVHHRHCLRGNWAFGDGVSY